MEYLKNPSKFNFDFEAYEKFYSVFTSAETTKYTEIQKKKFLVLYALFVEQFKLQKGKVRKALTLLETRLHASGSKDIWS